MLTDLRRAFRSLRQSPGFTVVVVLIIALGIGANTAIFSVVRSVLLRPLPLENPEQLVRLRENFAAGNDETQLNLAPITWQRWRQYNEVFTDIGLATGASLTMQSESGAQFIPAARVSFNFFSVLGVKPILGRNLREDEDQPGVAPVALISHALWQREFGGRDDVLGRQIQLDGAMHTIVGVMPPAFRHPYRAEIWVPLALRIDPAAPVGHYLYAPARLKPGVTLERARESMRALCARIEKEYPNPINPRAANVTPLHQSFVRDLEPKMVAVTAAAGFVLLIAGANLASLLLARQIEREAETSIRAALGASRGRLIRELLAQSLVLAVAGSALGVLLAMWLAGPLFALSPMASDTTGSAMREFDPGIHIDGPVLALSAALALFTGLFFGLLPALRGTRGDLSLALKSSGRGQTLSRGTRQTLGLLVVGEIAAAVLLLVATGLMVKSFYHLINEPWGFETENRLVFNVTFTPRLRPEHEARTAYVQQALEKLRALPGVESVTATTPEILSVGFNMAAVTPEGTTPPTGRGYFLVSHYMVFPGYFKDFGIPIIRGRGLEATDRAGGQKVAVVSAAFAKYFWPGQNPIGKIIKRGRADDPRPPYVVVGVAADVKGMTDANDGQLPGRWYLPYAQNPNFLGDDIYFIMHTRVAPESLQAAARAAIAEVDPAIAGHEFNTLDRMVDDTYVQDRFALLLVSLFGLLGLLLAAVGLYGLLAFQVARRTREIGVRTALGAQARDIVVMVFRQGAGLVLGGLGLGIFLALGLSPLLRAQLHSVEPIDPIAYAATAAILLIVATLACWLPARRAAKVDPMIALRAE